MNDDLAGMRPTWLVRPLVWLADKMSGPLFIVQFVLFLLVWMLINTLTPWRFDKWPFMGLNLFMLALIGIQAAVIGALPIIAVSKLSKPTPPSMTTSVSTSSRWRSHEKRMRTPGRRCRRGYCGLWREGRGMHEIAAHEMTTTVRVPEWVPGHEEPGHDMPDFEPNRRRLLLTDGDIVGDAI